MKKLYLPAAVLPLCLSILLPVNASAAGTTRVVDNDGRASSVSCEAANPAPSTIQAAIDLSDTGDAIYVCPGIYEEQLKIVAKNLTIRGVTSGDQNQVLIKPSGVVANSTNAYSGTAIAAVIAVEDSAYVLLRNLTVDGGDNQLTSCVPGLVGVFYRNSSGSLEASAVRDVRFAEDVIGCQTGLGVFVQSGGGGSSALGVTGTSIHNYQKAGIVANEIGTTLDAVGNTVSGDGLTTVTVQNGIQIGFGADGRIATNSIANHVYTCPAFPCSSSTNVLVYESHRVRVLGNTATNAVIGIYLVRSNGSQVRDNTVSNSNVLDGIAVVGDNNRVQDNSIVKSDEFALYVEGSGNRLEKNTINEAPCGIFASTGNTLNGNTAFNTELVTCVPFTLARMLASRSSRAQSSLLSGASAALAVKDASGVILREVTAVR
jgi:parallel beta-helix repeat protein